MPQDEDRVKWFAHITCFDEATDCQECDTDVDGPHLLGPNAINVRNGPTDRRGPKRKGRLRSPYLNYSQLDR